MLLQEAEKLDEIFEPFGQLRAETANTREGTGLGLAISRDLARGMGGDLTVDSTIDKGSTFVLRMPRTDFGATSSPGSPVGGFAIFNESRPPE